MSLNSSQNLIAKKTYDIIEERDRIGFLSLSY